MLVQRREVHVELRVGNALGLAVPAIGICLGSKPPSVSQTHSFHGKSFEQDRIAQFPQGYCLVRRENLGRCRRTHLIDSPDRDVYTYSVSSGSRLSPCEKTMNRTKKTRQGKRSRAVQVAEMSGSSCRIVIIKDGQFVHAQAKRPAQKVTASR